ncbi:uncharacterized protein [Drosophila tropicalis]|uniref:uncharacterized protein n=1 Tax=Drosophila tropicalis TaxID=46794 RepID=UPI0035AC272D
MCKSLRSPQNNFNMSPIRNWLHLLALLAVIATFVLGTPFDERRRRPWNPQQGHGVPNIPHTPPFNPHG